MYNFIIPDAPKHIELIDNERDVGKAVNHLLRWDMLGFDVETYHSIERHIPAFDPETGARMRLAQFATPKGRAFVFDLYKVSKNFLYMMFPNPYLCVIHNANFELKYLMYEMGLYKYGQLHCTMIAEQILAQGRVSPKEPGYVPIGLDATAKRRLNIVLPKDEQKSDWYKKVLTDDQIEYAARDAQVVLPIEQLQVQSLEIEGQVRTAELEFEAMPAVAFMQLSGVMMDKEAWVKRCDAKTIERAEHKRKLMLSLGRQGSLFDGGKDSFNLNSGPETMLALEQYGVRIPVDKDGKRTLAAKLFEDQLHIPVVGQFVDFVKVNTALKSFGYKWLEKPSPIDGRIHTKIKQIGAETGRMSSPDMLVIPKDDLTRNCFIAEDGWVLIDADYSQCELRIIAEYSRDTNLLFAFDNDYDLHKFSGHLIYQVPLEDVTKEQRGVAKNLNFGIVYGIGSRKFAYDAKITPDEGQRIMDYYLKKAYPDMGLWLETRGASVLYSMMARTMSGRIRKYMGDLHDKQFKAQVQRNAKNLPIQGTNADITKRAMALVYNELVDRKLTDVIRMLLVVHDELLLEARPWMVETAKDILTRNMLKAEREFLRRVPAKVDCNVMLKWYKEVPPEHVKETEEYIKYYA